MRMEISLSFHNTRMRLIFANSRRTKFKSGILGALAISLIAVKHVKRALSRTSSPRPTAPISSVHLRKRMRSGCWRMIFPDLIGGMRSMTLYLGILAANTRNLFLSPSERCLNSQVIVLRSSSSSGSVASLMTLFGKPSVRNFRCSLTAFPSEFDKTGSMYWFPSPTPFKLSGLSGLSEPSEPSEFSGAGHPQGHGHKHESPLPNRRRPQYAAKERKVCHKYHNR